MTENDFPEYPELDLFGDDVYKYDVLPVSKNRIDNYLSGLHVCLLFPFRPLKKVTLSITLFKL